MLFSFFFIMLEDLLKLKKTHSNTEETYDTQYCQVHESSNCIIQ